MENNPLNTTMNKANVAAIVAALITVVTTIARDNFGVAIGVEVQTSLVVIGTWLVTYFVPNKPKET